MNKRNVFWENKMLFYMKRILNISVVLALAIVILAGCGGKKETGTTSADSQYKDTLVVVIDREPTTMYPPEQADPGSNCVLLVYNQFITTDGPFREDIIGEIAQRWEYLDDITIRFFLVDNAYFSNGEKLTAEDVKFSLLNANADPFVQMYGQISKIDIVDDTTIDITTTEPNAAFLRNLAATRSASIINKKHFEAVGREGYARNPLGTGPYVMESWTTGQEMVLKAREDYQSIGKRTKGATPAIIVRFILEASSRSMVMETGEADVLIGPDMTDLDRLEGLGLTVLRQASNVIAQVNVNAGGLPDIKIREALAWAIDYPALVDAVYGDMATVADSFLTPLMLGHAKDWDVTYNPEKAKQLVAESKTPNGTNLELIVWNTPETMQLAEILQFYWREVGINVNIITGNTGPIRDQFFAGDYQIYPTTHSWGEVNRATNNYALRPTSFNIPDPYNSQIIDLWNKGLRETIDQNKRVGYYTELLGIVKNQWVTIPLAFLNIAKVTSDKVEGIMPSPGTEVNLWQIKVRK
jgi:peptide/nickel transport system substrate-binding protein